MNVKAWAVWGAIPLLLVGMVVGSKVAKRFPPYELGVHGQVIAGELAGADAGGPRVGNCPVFPRDNVWNMPIDKLAKDQRSDAYIESIGVDRKVHADFGSDLKGGIPFSEVPAGTRPVPVTFEYRDDSDLGNYPIPENAPIEGGGGSGGGDRHVVVIDLRRCVLYEMFDSHPLPGGERKAGSGIKMDLTSNALRESGKTSADAAGLPIFPGLVRYDEVTAGEINHALRFTIPHTQGAFIWPARHRASGITDLRTPPMGVRFRLRRDFDVSGYSKANQVILTALKRYGMFLADNGSSIFISGVPDKRWDDSDLHKLGKVTGADFEAVDESGWQMLADSARVDPLALK